MKFIEIVETVDGIESKLESLSEAKLGLLEAILTEGVETSFDVVNHLDYLVAYVNSYSDKAATTISETVDCGKVLNIVLESARKHTTDTSAFITEAQASTGEIDIQLLEEDTKTGSVTLLSVVTNTLTEMFGESAVETMPAEMVFDIVESTKSLDISDDSSKMDLVALVEEISTQLESSIKEGKIDLDTDDYTGETLAEFLNDYSDTEDLLSEMAQVTDEVLAESTNEDASRLLAKAKAATIMVEAQLQNCQSGDLKCMMDKAKNAKKWYSKHEMPGGGNIKDVKVDALGGKLGTHVKTAIKAFKDNHGKAPLKDYVQFILVPGIIKRMRMKNKKMGVKANMKKQGMK
jgi:hypothetical protein